MQNSDTRRNLLLGIANQRRNAAEQIKDPEKRAAALRKADEAEKTANQNHQTNGTK